MRVLIVGATSAIAQAAARYFAAHGALLFLSARNPQKLSEAAADLRVRGAAQVTTKAMDVADFDLHAPLIEEARQKLGGFDVVLIAHGTLGDQKVCEKSYEATEKELKINFLSVVSLLTPLANILESQQSGCLAVISSVAGDRSRQSNYVYGTAKGAVSLFLQGLRNRLHKSGITVLTIKPGFVDTPMTAGLKKNPLFASPDEIGRGIYRAIQKKRDVVYLPGYWRGIMLAVKILPEFLFKRLSL